MLWHGTKVMIIESIIRLISVKEAELKILQDEDIALTSWALTWFLGKIIPADLYANMTVLQIHEEMAFAVMSFCPCLIGTKGLFESLDLTPKAVSKYFNTNWT